MRKVQAMEYIMRKVQAYETQDGLLFSTTREAETHEDSLRSKKEEKFIAWYEEKYRFSTDTKHMNSRHMVNWLKKYRQEVLDILLEGRGEQ